MPFLPPFVGFLRGGDVLQGSGCFIGEPLRIPEGNYLGNP